jgi:phytoene synthase
MQSRAPAWEQPLIGHAFEAMHEREGVADSAVEPSASALLQAHVRCEAITREHSRTFYLASTLLPSEQRLGARALYAFCRISDDIADCGAGDRAAALADWREVALGDAPPASPLHADVALAWADTRMRFGIPVRYAEQLIEGVARDLAPGLVRYETFEELAAYCYGVASTVGLMAMHIVGFRGEEAVPYAVRLGVALQLTNILRDIGEDLAVGRMYLPLAELREFGLCEDDLARGVVDERWLAFMRFQVRRNRRLYAEALPGVALLDPRGRLGIAAAAELYRAILDDIEAHGGRVFDRRAHVSGWNKLRRLPGIWLRVRRMQPPRQRSAESASEVAMADPTESEHLARSAGHHGGS